MKITICNLQLIFLALLPSAAPAASVVEAIGQAQPKIVKIYGAGGVRGMVNYQSGILISPEGHILTAYSHVLDTDYIDAVLADGRKFDAKLLGADPRLEVAVLKIDATGLACFDLAKAAKAEAGARVLCFSNIFGVAWGDEQASVQRGTVAVLTRLEARRGVFETPYNGPVYVLDVTTNNPGAAGGAVVGFDGELVGMLGKELRNSLNNTWLNYAVPIAELRRSVEEIRAGKFLAGRDEKPEKKPERPLDLAALGIVLVPDVLERTPPFVDRVAPARPPRRPACARRPHPLGRRPLDPVVQGAPGGVGVHRLRGPDPTDGAPGAEVDRVQAAIGRPAARRQKGTTMSEIRQIANCKLQIENCKFAICYLQFVLFLGLLLSAAPTAADDTAAEEQAAFAAAVDRVAPAVVQIQTTGGLERVQGVLLGTGPTTGLAVDPGGYIISSAFNFIGKPASILVRLADGTLRPAKLVATDHARMLVLLKIETDHPLPVCEIAPRRQMRVGQWTIAVGRTFPGGRPNMAVGILSALDRVWGRAIQTDAAVSPNNYGGPLVDIRGRVMGVLVPLSPQGAGEVAGMEWYDSGIGFAVPAEDIQRVLPRLIKGEDLFPGVAGVSLKGPNQFTGPPVVAACRPKSPAAAAGVKVGDQIVELGGRPISRAVEVRDELGRRYAGDKVSITVLRGKKRITSELVLAAKLEPFQHGFFGILPMRSGKEEGIAIRYVYPDSPAAAAGVAAGDVLVSLAGEPVHGRLDLWQKMGMSEAGTEVELEVRRGDAVRKVKVLLAALPEGLPPDELPPAREPSKGNANSRELTAPGDAFANSRRLIAAGVEADAHRRLLAAGYCALAGPPAKPAQAARPAVGAVRLKIPEYSNEVWAYVPAGYDPEATYGVVVWLHAPGGFEWKELRDRWKALCDRHELILLAPKSSNPSRWEPGETALVDRLLMQVATTYHVDPARIAVHGYEGGGAMAFLTAFHNQAVRAVAAVEAAPIGAPPESDPLHRLAVYLAWGQKSPAARPIAQAAAALRKAKVPVTAKDLGELPRYLDADELAQLARWIDMLDRI